MKQTYVGGDSPYKENTRKSVVKIALSHLKHPIHCLSLPADNFLFEEKLLKEIDTLQIDTVEISPYLYNKCKSKAKELGMSSYKNRDVFKHLAKEQKQYDIIWLDLCAKLTPKLINNLIPVVQGQYTSKEAIVAITTTRAREVLLPRMSNFYGFTSLEQFRGEGLTYLLSTYAKFNNVKLSLLKRITYKNPGKSIPMQVLIYKLKKNEKTI